MEYVLKTKELTKIYAGKPAVDHVNIEIKKGDIYGFIGRNGAGKTTFIRTVVGLAKPSSGEIELFEDKNLEKGRSKIGTVIEYPAVYPHLTAKQNMEAQRLLMGVSDKKKTEELLDIVGLKGTGNKKAKNFSLGMKQRLAIALALIGEPEFLFLDEPINGLDPAGIKDIRDLILKLNREHGITIMVSSHILGELSKIATCYGVINDGKLVDQFRAEELKDRVMSGVRLKVNDVDRACKILTQEIGVVKYRKDGDDSVIIFDHNDDMGKINSALTSHDIIVSSIINEGNDFEEYFIQLMGVGKND